MPPITASATIHFGVFLACSGGGAAQPVPPDDAAGGEGTGGGEGSGAGEGSLGMAEPVAAITSVILRAVSA